VIVLRTRVTERTYTTVAQHIGRLAEPGGSVTVVVDVDAAIGYVVAHGDPVERARLSFLRTGATPPPGAIERITEGQMADGGWPASGDGRVPSVDATCYRLGELDDLGGLRGPAVDRALNWLAGAQRDDGTWQEDESLAAEAPAWAMPGDPEATLYLTSVAGFWLAVAEEEAHPHHEVVAVHDAVMNRASQFILSQTQRTDGGWDSAEGPLFDVNTTLIALRAVL
jgi:hypothetical protein